MEYLQQHTVDLVLLDICLPEMDGFQLAEEIKKRWPKLALLFLTGCPEFANSSRAFKLNIPYLIKPDDIDVLSSLEELLQHLPPHLQESSQQDSCPPSLGNLSINRESQEIYCRDSPLPLTRLEFKLLLYFLERPNRIVSYEELSQNVLNSPLDMEKTRPSIHVHLSSLRKKLQTAKAALSLQNVRALGYLLRLK